MGTPKSIDDQKLYNIYAGHVNAGYPDFLRRFGIMHVATHAEGSQITDSAGNRYIDCTAGYGLFNLGHNPPQIIQALVEQLQSKSLLTRPLITSVQAEFSERITHAAPEGLDYVFLCNSGSEAIDSAIKLARLTSRRKKKIIAANGSFHGYTYGALSVTGIRKFRKSFEPMLPDVEFIDYGNLEDAAQAIDKDTAAIILEPIQHEAGVNVPPNDYFAGIRDICNKRGALLIMDEVKTGLGKTGHLFACEGIGVNPDILVLGKSLGGGLIPSGAILASSNLWKWFGLSFPMSASSYAGNALACRAGLATLDTLSESNILQKCLEKGQKLKAELEKLAALYPEVLVNTSGQGLLHGLKLANENLAFKLSKQLINQGVLAIPAFGNPTTIMLEPPLVIISKELEFVIKTIGSVLKTLK